MEIISREAANIRSLAKVERIEVDAAYAPAKTDASAVMADCELFIPLKDLIDVDKEKARLTKEVERVAADLDRIEKKLGNESFTGKAPAEVVNREKARRDELSEMLAKLRESLAKLG